MSAISVTTQKRWTSLRISEKTKMMLNALAKGKESHDEIILRLIKMANSISSESGTLIADKGNIVATKYGREHKTLNIEIDGIKYSVVCTYNDLSIIALLRNNQLRNYMSHKGHMDWELNLEMVNVNKGGGWSHPTDHKNEESRLLYLICAKRILEEAFDIVLYQIINKEDYFSIDKWAEAYDRNDLSRDSLQSDIKEKIR